MRILTTTLCYPTRTHPDQGIFVQRRARALAEHWDTDVRVLCPVLWCPLLRRRVSEQDQHSPLWATYPKMFSPPVIGWSSDGLSYAKTIEKFITQKGGPGWSGVDLIDAHFVYPEGVGAWLAGRKLGIPVAVTIRGKIVSLSRRAIRRAQIRAMLRGVDVRIAVSESLAAWAREIAGSDLDIDVIPNGVDNAVFHYTDSDRVRSELGWNSQSKYLLAVGHMQKLKGFDLLVAALPAIRAARGDVRLILAGSRRGERRFGHQLRRRIARYNSETRSSSLNSCIEFVGPVASGQLNLMYNAADLVVNASRSEGWNNAITESLACGTPVVAADVGGNREQICSNELGIVVPANQVKALAEGVITALEYKWDHRRIAAHGQARGWDQVAGQVHKVFQRLLDRRAELAGNASFPYSSTPPQSIMPTMEAWQ